MKAIMISIRPQWVAKILNGEKTIEIRKKFPKDFVGWVYIYCTKDKLSTLMDEICVLINGEKYHVYSPVLNGKVVARFWCDKVEEHKDFACMFPYNKLRYNKATCLSEEDLEDYGFVEGKGFVPLYAIHIDNLEIFDRPRLLKEFQPICKDMEKGYKCLNCLHYWTDDSAGYSISQCGKQLKAPQSWCYVEV